MLDYEQIKKALLFNGFKFVKLEFEVNVCDNSNECEFCNEGEETCCDCDGTGTVDIVNVNGDVIDSCDCPQCDGNGEVTCSECNGHWQGENNLATFQERFIANFPRGFHPNYINTYDDHSVNTETTMTFPVEGLHQVEKVIQAFVKTCESYDDWDTDGAGFHISILPSSNYPSETRLPKKKIENFLYSINKISDAMFLLASGDGKETRAKQYRIPRANCYDKYSAVYTHDNTCIEYRVFDPCYLRPERFRLFMNTIVRTLKFYSEKRILNEKDWKSDDLRIRDNKSKMEELMTDKAWKMILFKKLAYLYSDKGKLERIEKYNKEGKISDKTAILEIAK